MFAGAGLLVREAHGPPEFVQRYTFSRSGSIPQSVTTIEVRAVEDSWDVPGIWRRPGLTGDTWSSEVRIHEVYESENGPPSFEPVRVPVTIVDNDPPMVSLHGGAAVTEGSAAGFTVRATSPPTSALTVRYVVRQNDPYVIFPGDFVAPGDLGAKTVRLPAGALSATFSVPTVGDEADEADGSVRVTLETGTGYTLAAPRYQAVAVADDDPAVLTLEDPGFVFEGGTARFKVRSTSPGKGGLTVSYEAAESGNFFAASSLGVRSVRFPDGSRTAVISIPTVDDSLWDPQGTLTVSLRAGSGYVLGAPSSATIGVFDLARDRGFDTDEGDSDDGYVPDPDPDEEPEPEPKSDSESVGEPGSDGVPGDGGEPSQADGGGETQACGSAAALAVKARANHDALANTAGNRKERNDWWRAWIALSAKTGTYNTPLTAAEAGALESGDARWAPYRQALECVEGASASPGDGGGGSDGDPGGGDEPSQACGSAAALAVKARANHDALANTAGNRKERNDWWRAWIALSAKTGTYNTPLTATEARALEAGDARWTPYRQALECVEGAP